MLKPLTAGLIVVSFAAALSAQPAGVRPPPGAVRRAPPTAATQQVKPPTKDELSYCIGQDVGRALSTQEIEIDPEIFMKGFTEAYQKKQSKYTDDEFRAIMDRFRQSQMVKQRDRMTRLAEENIGKGQAFLDANKTKKGVQVTASGLQYRVIKKGNGPKPDQNSTVEVQYVGKLIDGTEFDSSIKRGAPATFPVTGVIPGWTEALLLMNVGSKFELVIPSNLAYGERGGGPIPPNSVLIFEVELLSVKAGNTPPPAPGQ